MKEPRSGPKVKIESHQAPTECRPKAATDASIACAKARIGRLAAIVMITKTKSGSVKFKLSMC